MKNKIIQWGLSVCCIVLLWGCIEEEEYANNPQGNFEQLWKIIDEQYCFLDYKQVDWDAIREKIQKKIYPEMDEHELFSVLNEMLNHLKDGHVNLSSDFNQSHYNPWGNAPTNFDESIILNTRYLGRSYSTASGMKYKILKDNIGYIYYESFLCTISEKEVSEALTYLSTCKGLIFDVRQNSGGNASNSARIASRFVQKRTLRGYICHKNGTGHSDFSEPYAMYLEPSNGVRWHKRIAVLTNRHSYSATNDFINNMKGLPNVTIIGDNTGGGSGMPFTSELPNGWTVRFSASPHFNDKMDHIEWGIVPDIKIDMNKDKMVKGIDTIIEKAREVLSQQQSYE